MTHGNPATRLVELIDHKRYPVHELTSARSATVIAESRAHASPLRLVFESPLVTAFIGAMLDAQPLHPMADPLGALNTMFYGAGDQLGWHFDNAEFAVTLMLQPSDEGRVFEYVPMLRTEADANDAGVNALLAGSTTGLRTMSGAAGTLALFRGHWSPHRVTPVVGATEHINAVLAYSRRPDHRMSTHGQHLFYGRAKV